MERSCNTDFLKNSECSVPKITIAEKLFQDIYANTTNSNMKKRKKSVFKVHLVVNYKIKSEINLLL
jgi:hypothetical protein